jgi:hypothetical protein
MRSRIVHLPAGPALATLQAATAEIGRAPDFVLAFLPAEAVSTIRAMSEAWPGSLRLGCEAVTQFAGAAMTCQGSVQLFWLDHPEHQVEVEILSGSHEEPPAQEAVDALARRLAAADGALLLADGLRFPAERLLADLRDSLSAAEPGSKMRVAGGLASQREPVVQAGARVFVGDRIFPSACLAVTFQGVAMRIEVVRGWSPASPVYTVTRAEGSVAWEIDGEPAADWYRRFFTVDGELAPMPETAYRFPLILEGPEPGRQGLYRSLRFFDEPPGAVTFWGSIQTGDRVRLGIGNDRNDISLVRTASELSGAATAETTEAAILFSCVGREAVLGDKADQEAAAIHRALGGIALSGFFTFGEIGPTPDGDLAFYNHTAILVLLTERITEAPS